MEQDAQTFSENMRSYQREMYEEWIKLANRLGTVAVDIAAPKVRVMAATLFGCQELDSYEERMMRSSQRDRQRTAEFDFIIIYGNYLFINETIANNPNAEYVLEFVEKLEDLFDFFPHYRGKTVISIFSSLHLTEPIVQLLTKHKIYAMNLRSEAMELLNYEAVRQ